MKLSKLALIAAIACGIPVGNASAEQNGFGIFPVSHLGADCDFGHPLRGCDSVDPSCDAASCDGGCDSLAADGLGDPWKLFSAPEGWDVGGWANVGYHTAALRNFYGYPDQVQLHQGWLYAEKSIDTSNGFDIGGRLDYLYGTDAQDTQAFGTQRGWDNGWDNGQYGHALPQAYFEAGYGDLSVKVGHFFTIIGWEVVQATGNFFYSHSYTMYNSEPFTHTGALATYQAGESTTLWGGYVLGWDGGFDDNGDAFLGGISQGVSDDLTLIYATTMGRFGESRFADARGVEFEKGYMHSLIADYAVSENLQYIIQNDVLNTTTAGDVTARDTYGLNQYLIYTLNDNWSLGSRFEWWSVAKDSTFFNTTGPGRSDVYALTGGVNYRPMANLVIRPEVRYDWIREGDNAALAGSLFEDGRDQFTFGIDSIFLF